ncbi:MAG: galactofuranose transport system permease protein [Frankiales bacterium]|jgi:ribose/xylose/arabinose/galactoside ABC-type transport system permease subunit|nr:galactofuranose transport system permease protein [Frankiales bacterium]
MSETLASGRPSAVTPPDPGGLRARLSSVSRADALRWVRDNGVYLALAVLLVFDLFFTPRFVTYSNLNQQVVSCTRVIVVALGMALAIGTEGIDLSVGAVMALSGALLVEFSGLPAIVAILLALLAGAFVGALNGSLIAYVGVQPIVATLAFLFAGRSIATLLLYGHDATIQSDTINKISSGSIFGVRGLIIAALVPVLLVSFVVRKTTFGRRVVAIGDNLRASYLSGLPVKTTLILVYVTSGVLAAWAGVMDTSSIESASALSSGLSYELFAITAVVVGGTPLSGGRIRVVNTVVAAIFMQLLRSTLTFHNEPDAISQMITAVVIIVAVFVSRVRARA